MIGIVITTAVNGFILKKNGKIVWLLTVTVWLTDSDSSDNDNDSNDSDSIDIVSNDSDSENDRDSDYNSYATVSGFPLNFFLKIVRLRFSP